MRHLLNISFPHETFNAAAKDGTAGPKLERILAELKPEAAYFTEQGGTRGAVLIIDIPEPSKIPSICEPFFLLFNARVELRIVMKPEELAKAGLGDLAKKWT